MNSGLTLVPYRKASSRKAASLLRSLVSLLAAVLLVLSVVACGQDEEAERAAAQARAEQQERDRKRRALEKQAREAEEKASTCRQEMGDLVDALGELDSRLNVGLNYDEYTDHVGDLRVEYDRVDFGGSDPEQLDCLTAVGLPAEQAMNEYAKAAGTWDECFDDIDCDNDSIQPELQRRWSTASRRADKAERGLEKMEGEAERLTDEARELAEESSANTATTGD